MPTPQGKDTNKYRCEACGRYFNTEGEFRDHERECLAAQQTGQQNKPKGQGKDQGEDRDWVSTP